MAAPKRDKELTAKIVDTWHRLGSQSATARELGIDRGTVANHLKAAKIVMPVVAGRMSYLQPEIKPLPVDGEVKRYILTTAQNNTKINTKFFDALNTYADWIGAELMIGRMTYNKTGYSNPKDTKGKRYAHSKEDAWWDPAILPYVCDDPTKHGSCRWQLAPTLVFASEMNIIPTARRPLSGLETYTGKHSGIFPHSTLALESVATARHEPAKFNYTTGAVTQRNYIQKKTGLKAEFHHAYGALIVEVLPSGKWFVRQLNADSKGEFYDIPAVARGSIKVTPTKVLNDQGVEAINWGDIHASEINTEAMHVNWGKNGIIDQLKPKYQFMHDILSFRSRSHHEMKKFGSMFKKSLQGIDSVEDEVAATAFLANVAHREFCKMIIINSNHDRHGERWLDEADYRTDLLNAEFFLEAQLERVRAMRAETNWDFHTWALTRAGMPKGAYFLPLDDSFVICEKFGGGIECGMHGDLGPNGARGSTQNLTKVGIRINKGHDHKATIQDGVYSSGACALDFVYMQGPGSHSISHIVTFPNGKRCIITMTDGMWRAPN